MSNAALVNLWNYIESLSLSNRSKQWLADRLLESKSSNARTDRKSLSLDEQIEQGREEIRRGDCVRCNNKEELQAFLESL